MKETFFFRNIENYNELVRKDKQKRSISNHKQTYKIIKTILIDESEYRNFLNCFNRNWIFLREYIDEMKIKDNIWNCVLVTSIDNNGVLVMSDGYQYPRFTGLRLN